MIGPLAIAAGSLAGSCRDQKRRVTLDALALTLGLSAIATGLDQIQRGRAEEGYRVAKHGLDYLRERIGGANAEVMS